MKFAVVRNFVIALVVLFCAGCASAPPAEPPIKPGMAQIILHRVGNVALDDPAIVEINGLHVVNLGTSDVYTGDINPGPVVITVHSYIVPGRYVLNFVAGAGTIYRFRVSPRGDSALPLGHDFIVTEATGSYQIGPNN
jgi:hypothetical protein